MGLSSTHIELVRAITAWVGNNCSADECAAMLIDLPEISSANKPVAIEGYIPDVYIKLGRRIIGEAKTRNDIETIHSREQYAGYLKHLRMYENSVLLIAVPWYSVPQARSLIRRIQRIHDAMEVNSIFIEKLPG